jgi:hypothetical protein
MHYHGLGTLHRMGNIKLGWTEPLYNNILLGIIYYYIKK